MPLPKLRDVVVLGGTGFIGRPLVSALAENGCRVRVLSRQPGLASSASPVIYVAGSVANAAQIQEITAGADTVFHLATGGGDSWADFHRDFVQGARNVAEACLKSRVRRLIYTSSIAALYLGEARAIDEKLPVDPKAHRRSLYSRAKAETERTLNDLHASRQLPVIIMRPGVVMGRNGLLTHSGTGYWASDVSCIGWGRGRTPVPFVLVQDIVHALLLAMDKPGIEGSTFNLVGDVRLTAAEFVRIVAERSRRDIRFYPRSLAMLQIIEIAKWVLKVAARKPENAFPSYRDLKSRALISQFDCSAPKKILGWSPNSDVEVFLRESIDCHLRPVLTGDLRTASRP